MNFSVHHSTPNQDLTATNQARRELGDSRKILNSIQLDLWESQNKPQGQASPYLQIRSVPVDERINPKEIRYALWIYPQGIRACGGQFTAEEAHEISKSTRGWDWSKSQASLEQLLDGICKRSSVKKAGGGC